MSEGLRLESKLVGVAEAIASVKAKADQQYQAMTKAITDGALMIEGDAKVNCPVDEGRLRSSITHEIVNDLAGHQLSARVGTNVFYAPYIEFGTGIYAKDGTGRKTPWVYRDRRGVMHFTRGIRPRAFLANAFSKNIGRIQTMITGALS